MILGWKTDMMGLMLAFQFTMPFSITQGQNFPCFPYNLAQHLSSIHQNHILPYHHTFDNTKQGITNMLALPIDKMLYICLLYPHSEHQNNPFQSKQSKHFHQRNQFTKFDNKIKLSKLGFNATVLVPVGEEPNQIVTVVFKDNPSGLNMQIDSHWMKSQTPK
jgi:hypothetical protein